MTRIGIRSFAASAVHRLLAWALACAVPLSALSVAAGASDRIALVGGNAEYEHVRDLANPMKDAADIGAALGRLGFEVTRLENVGYLDLLRGLARVEPRGSSMMAAYSASEGTTAADGEPGGNSPYAAALLKHLERPELHVGDLFMEVRKVMLATPGSQTPVEKIFFAQGYPPPPQGASAAGGAVTVPADARLESGGAPFGDGLKQTLAELGREGFGYWISDWEARGETPLMAASSADARDSAAALVDCGADLGETNDLGWTPLHAAALGNAVEAAAALVDCGVDLEARDDFGSTPLHSSAYGNAAAAAALLIDRGADLEARNDIGSTPLHDAALRDAAAAAALLIDRGADLEARDGNGATPLHIAAFKNTVEAAALLIDRGADLEAMDDNGATPLHIAAFKNTIEAAKLLVGSGARVNATTDKGSTPLDWALREENSEVQAVLRSHGGRCAARC